jgi:hypothetical protein
MVARDQNLGKAEGNRDGKRSVVKQGRDNILWMVEGISLPASRWANIDMDRFRHFRNMKGGTKRAAAFFRENIGLVVHRSIVEALLFDQRDYMKRLRGNGGARDLLGSEGIDLLSGAFDWRKIEEARLGAVSREEFVAIRRENA